MKKDELEDDVVEFVGKAVISCILYIVAILGAGIVAYGLSLVWNWIF